MQEVRIITDLSSLEDKTTYFIRLTDQADY